MRDQKSRAEDPAETVSMQSASSIATLVLHLERRRAERWEPRAITYNPDGTVTALLIRAENPPPARVESEIPVSTAVPEWPRWMSVAVLARYISKTPGAVRQLLKRGHFGGCTAHLGSSLLFDRLEVDRLLERETIGRRPVRPEVRHRRPASS
jgi:hypothetical protein